MLWLAVALLAMLNATTVGTIIYHNMQDGDDEVSIVLEPDAPPLNGRYFKQVLGFDSQQMEVFRASNRSFRSQANGIVSTINAQKESLFAELQRPAPDTSRINKIAEEIGRSHTALKRATAQFYLSLSHVCSAQQKGKLEAIFTPLFRETPTSGGCGGNGACRGNRDGKVHNSLIKK